MARYEGGDDARPSTVTRYLIENYEVDEVTATKLVAADAGGELATGMRCGSMAYYVGDKLAQAAKLIEREGVDEEGDVNEDEC